MAEPTKDEIAAKLKAAEDRIAELELEAEAAANAEPITGELLTMEAQPVNVTIVQPDRSAEGAQIQLDGQKLLAEYEKPGVFVVNGQKVDGNGVPVKHAKADSE